MKKVIFWLLSIALALGMTAALAESECTHANVTTWQKSEMVFVEIEGDNRFCNGSENQYEISYCKDCKVQVSKTLIEEGEKYEYRHDYDENWKCTNCGHVNDCAHGEVEISTAWSNHVYEFIDSRDHRITYDLYEQKYCYDCFCHLEETLLETGLQDVTQHDYDEETGECYGCGYVNTCTHENTSISGYFDWDTVSYEPLDEKNHLISGEFYEETYCDDCGMYMGSVKLEGIQKESEAHYFEDGFCANCGQENTCKHALTDTSVRSERTSCVRQDDETHIVYGAVTTTQACLDCGVTVDRTVEENRTLVEKHAFVDGACAHCGAANVCAHEAAVEYDYIRYTSIEYIDEATHKRIGARYRMVSCFKCGALLANELVQENDFLVMEHSFYQDQCQCGYTISCAHENVTQELGWAMMKVVSREETTHTILARTFDDTVCNDCGQTVGRKLKEAEATLTDEHTYIDSETVCQVCAHVKKQDEPGTAPEYADGWNLIDGQWYYYADGEKVVNSWMKDSVGWVWLGSDGAMVTNAWVTDSKGWCYVGSDGYAVTNCWKQDSVGWCYLDSEGSMVKNAWVQTDGEWYWLNGEGYRVTDAWVSVDGKWYWMGGDGAMVTNAWRRDSIGWVWLGSDGAMVTNAWVTDSKGWCYVGSDGYAVTNCWKRDSVGWCYLDSEGSMVKNAWVQTDGEWYWLNGEGYRATGTVVIDGKEENFDSDGVWIG